MTVTSGFFNSVNHDRKYNAEEISSIFDGIILDGVYQGFGEALKVEGTSTANQVKIGTGRAWFNHTWTLNDEALYLTLPAPNSTYPRIDAIVLEVNNSSSVRANTIKYISGSAASSPAKPSLTNTTDVHQYPLAYITRPKATTTVSAGNIENAIGTSACPIVTGVLEVLDDDRFIAQTIANLTTDFNTWFEGIKDTLDENTAANLLNKINENYDELKEYIDQNAQSIKNIIDDSNYLGTKVTDAQKARIADGTFYGLPLGGYWKFDDINFYIVGQNSINDMKSSILENPNPTNKNHLVLLPNKKYRPYLDAACYPYNVIDNNTDALDKNCVISRSDNTGNYWNSISKQVYPFIDKQGLPNSFATGLCYGHNEYIQELKTIIENANFSLLTYNDTFTINPKLIETTAVNGIAPIKKNKKYIKGYSCTTKYDLLCNETSSDYPISSIITVPYYSYSVSSKANSHNNYTYTLNHWISELDDVYKINYNENVVASIATQTTTKFDASMYCLTTRELIYEPYSTPNYGCGATFGFMSLSTMKKRYLTGDTIYSYMYPNPTDTSSYQNRAPSTTYWVPFGYLSAIQQNSNNSSMEQDKLTWIETYDKALLDSSSSIYNLIDSIIWGCCGYFYGDTKTKCSYGKDGIIKKIDFDAIPDYATGETYSSPDNRAQYQMYTVAVY